MEFPNIISEPSNFLVGVVSRRYMFELLRIIWSYWVLFLFREDNLYNGQGRD